MDKRDYRILVFKDTESKVKANYEDDVKSSIARSKIYYAYNPKMEWPATKDPSYTSKCAVNKTRSFEAAENVLSVCPGMKVAVLNFASAKNPGGYVAGGSSAQEESLCRVSTLYNVISDEKFQNPFYKFHRFRKDNIYTDRLIYSPDIKIIKDDDFLDLDKPVTVDVITCAAPNLSASSKDASTGTIKALTDEELYTLQYNRCMNIISAAAMEGVDILVLGAFGCGVFKNNPKIVAKAMKDALAAAPYKFYRVIFPIFCREWETENYDAFKEVLC